MEIEKFIKENKETTEKIRKFLTKIGMNEIYCGFEYWNIAIMYYLYFKQKDIYKTIRMESVYDFIAKEMDSTRNRVERAMRFTVEKSNYIKQMKLNCRLSNKQFLYKSAAQFLDY